MDTIIKSLLNFYFIFSLIYYKIYIKGQNSLARTMPIENPKTFL